MFFDPRYFLFILPGLGSSVKTSGEKSGTCLSASIPERSNTTQQTQSQVVERALTSAAQSPPSASRPLDHRSRRRPPPPPSSAARRGSRPIV